MTGVGKVVGTVHDMGTHAPGNSAGVHTIEGTWNKTGGSVEIELGGTFDGGGDKSLTEFDWILVTGNVFLAGKLNVDLINAFELGSYQQFEIINVGGTLTGQFDGLGEGASVGNFGEGEFGSAPYGWEVTL